MEKTPKIYCGNGKKIGQKGIAMSVNLDKIPAEHIKTSKKGDRWVNLTIWMNDEPDQFGYDYSCQVDTYVPKENKAETGSDLPF